MAISFILILKTIILFDKPVSSRNNSSKLTFSKNDNSKPAFRRNNGGNKIKFGNDNIKYAKKLEKSKSLKMFKSWNLAKSKKKLSKNKNLLNFDIMEAKPKFLTLNAKIAFNCL